MTNSHCEGKPYFLFIGKEEHYNYRCLPAGIGLAFNKELTVLALLVREIKSTLNIKTKERRSMKMIKTLQKTRLTLFLFALLGASSSYALTFDQIKQTLEKGSQKEISLMEENYQKLYTKNFMSSCIKAANIKQAENYCKCSLEGLIEQKVLELRLEKYF